jgi:hypothetical protein
MWSLELDSLIEPKPLDSSLRIIFCIRSYEKLMCIDYHWISISTNDCKKIGLTELLVRSLLVLDIQLLECSQLLVLIQLLVNGVQGILRWAAILVCWWNLIEVSAVYRLFLNKEHLQITADNWTLVFPVFMSKLDDSYLVDPASSHMLVSKIKPCMSKYKQTLYCETANGSLNQL